MCDKHDPDNVNPSNSITIERVNNGLIVDDHETKRVFECEDDFGEDRMAGVRGALYTILESLGFYGSKHDRERIEIKIVHGDNFECTDKECEICEDETKS